MINNISKFHFVPMILFFLGVVSLSCQELPKTNIPDDLDGMLLYIEDLDGKGEGNYSWDFGDIVAYNPDTKERFILTSNKYFDIHPSYSSKLKRVIFESERYKESSTIGILNKANIYSLDIHTKKVSQITNERFKERFKKILNNSENYKRSSIGSDSESIIFCTLLRPGINSLYTYNLETDELKEIMHELYYFADYIYNSSENKLYYENYENPENEYYDLRQVSIISLDINNNIQDTIIKSSNSANYLHDIRNGILLYEEFKEGVNTLCSYDLREKKEIYRVNINKLKYTEFQNPVFGKNTDEIYYLGQISETADEFKEDIYWMDLKTNKMRQITSNGNEKDGLKYCR